MRFLAYIAVFLSSIFLANKLLATDRFYGDVDGNQIEDFIEFVGDETHLYLNGYISPLKIQNSLLGNQQKWSDLNLIQLRDVNGDMMDDIVGIGNETINILLSEGYNFKNIGTIWDSSKNTSIDNQNIFIGENGHLNIVHESQTFSIPLSSLQRPENEMNTNFRHELNMRQNDTPLLVRKKRASNITWKSNSSCKSMWKDVYLVCTLGQVVPIIGQIGCHNERKKVCKSSCRKDKQCLDIKRY